MPPRELLTAGQHSRDFTGSRAAYIFYRQRIVSLVFALLALAWIPVDWLFLPEDVFVPILVCRLLFAGAFLFMAFCGGRATSLRVARLLLGAFILIPACMFVASQAILADSSLGGDPQMAAVVGGYGYLPYVMVTVMAIFPLTLLEGVGYALVTGAVYLLGQAVFHDVFTVEVLGEIWLLGLIAGVAVWVEVAQLGMLLRLYREATRDHLTGLVNRRVVADQLVTEIERAREQGQPLSVLLFDLDLFKRINDTHGHLAGDEVLRRFAEILDENLPADTLPGRYGGEEFIAVLPRRDTANAREIAESIAQATRRTAVTGSDGETITFTTSIGVAALRDDDTVDSLLGRVDGRLYDAKAHGRDLVAVAE
ncbi:MAG: GGDEF domain-containing protein [Guyparkeria sp.]